MGLGRAAEMEEDFGAEESHFGSSELLWQLQMLNFLQLLQPNGEAAAIVASALAANGVTAPRDLAFVGRCGTVNEGTIVQVLGRVKGAFFGWHAV